MLSSPPALLGAFLEPTSWRRKEATLSNNKEKHFAVDLEERDGE
jgi:hypothetical protein